jgi:hypothetical protein
MTENTFRFTGRIIDIQAKQTKKGTSFFMVMIRQDGTGRYGPTTTDLKATYWHQALPPGVKRHAEVIVDGRMTSYVYNDNTYNDHEALEFTVMGDDDYSTPPSQKVRADPQVDQFANVDDGELPY